MNHCFFHCIRVTRAAALGILFGLVPFAPAQNQPAVARKPAPEPAIPPAQFVVAAPKLELSSKLWDFGQRWGGEPVPMTEIVLLNQGRAPFIIGDVLTSCGCAAVAPKSGGVWKGKTVAPGAAEIMTIAFNTARQVKDVARTITILSNDPDQPRVVISVTGKVLNPFSGRPEDRIMFGRLVFSSNAPP